MTRHHSHRSHRGVRKVRKEDETTAPVLEAAEDVISEPQYTVLTAGEWSEWALDREGRGFYFRNRVGIDGNMEYDFASHRPFQTSRIPAYTPSYQTYYPSQPPPVQHLRPEPIRYAQRNFHHREDRSSSASDFSHSSYDQDFEAQERTSGITIPAIIDVDTENNVKVVVPNVRGRGEASLMWDHKSKHSGSRMSPGLRIREWLQSEFDA